MRQRAGIGIIAAICQQAGVTGGKRITLSLVGQAISNGGRARTLRQLHFSDATGKIRIAN